MKTLPFAVIFEGRAGSSELMARLNKNQKVEALPEILHPFCGEGGLNADWEKIEETMRRIAFGEHVDVYAESYTKRVDIDRPAPIRGFKTRLNSLIDRRWYVDHDIAANFYSVDSAKFLRAAYGYGYSLIYLYRYDLLRQSISWLRAAELGRRRGEWNVLASDEPLGPIELDPSDVMQTVGWLADSAKRHEDAFASYPGKKISLSYEELFGKGQHASYLRLLDFLSADAQLVSDHYRKATPADISEAVPNWSEIKQYLSRRLPDLADSTVPIS